MNSPFYTLFNQQPNYTKLRSFGCLCFPWLKPYTSNKLEPRSEACVFLGYSLTQSAYICYNFKTHKMYHSRHVQFIEDVFPLSMHDSTLSPRCQTQENSNSIIQPLTTLHPFSPNKSRLTPNISHHSNLNQVVPTLNQPNISPTDPNFSQILHRPTAPSQQTPNISPTESNQPQITHPPSIPSNLDAQYQPPAQEIRDTLLSTPHADPFQKRHIQTQKGQSCYQIPSTYLHRTNLCITGIKISRMAASHD